MRNAITTSLGRLHSSVTGPQALAFLPAVSLAAYWIGGEPALICAALGTPALIALTSSVTFAKKTGHKADHATGLMTQQEAESHLDQILSAQHKTGRTTASLALCIDDFTKLQRNLGQDASALILQTIAKRLRSALRDSDHISHLEGPQFGVVLGPLEQVDLETLIQLSARIQNELSEPVSIDAHTVHISVSVGFCLPSRAPSQTGAAFMHAANVALLDARANGAGSIRAFSGYAHQNAAPQIAPLDTNAPLEAGQVVAWFQPQTSTKTGRVSSMEVVARWGQPETSTVYPQEFFANLGESEKVEELNAIMLQEALTTLKSWDAAGYKVPTLSIKFSSTALADPKLFGKIQWELDRCDLSPRRLTIEIAEDVINSNNDSITRNVWALSQLGCGIDLADSGAGHASLANIRRFAVKRIKIGRFFVAQCDSDQDQRSILNATLKMANRLNLDTLAEGLETAEEHAMLSQLGCGYVQGNFISAPLERTQALEWMKMQGGAVEKPSQIAHQAS